MGSKRVCLIVEDKNVDNVLKDVLEGHSIDYVVEKSYSSALDYMSSNKFQYFITDNFLPVEKNREVKPLGINLVKYVRAKANTNEVPILLLSSDNSLSSDPQVKVELNDLQSTFVFKDLNFKRRLNFYTEFFNSSPIGELSDDFIEGLRSKLPEDLQDRIFMDDVREMNLISHEIAFILLRCQNDANIYSYSEGHFVIDLLNKLGRITSLHVSDSTTMQLVFRRINNIINKRMINSIEIIETIKLLRLSISKALEGNRL